MFAELLEEQEQGNCLLVLSTGNSHWDRVMRVQ